MFDWYGSTVVLELVLPYLFTRTYAGTGCYVGTALPAYLKPCYSTCLIEAFAVLNLELTAYCISTKGVTALALQQIWLVGNPIPP